MPESEESPAIRLSEPLAIFHRKVNPVVFAVEKASTGWFFPRAVRKSGVKNPSQFFYDDRSFGKGTRLQIRIYIFFLYLHVVIFGKARVSVIEAVGS